MANIYTSAEQLVGKTPLLELTHIEKELGLKAKILAKNVIYNDMLFFLLYPQVAQFHQQFLHQ